MSPNIPPASDQNPLGHSKGESLDVSSGVTLGHLQDVGFLHRGTNYLSHLTRPSSSVPLRGTLSEELFRCMGLLLSPAGGVHLYSPLGTKILERLEDLIIEQFQRIGGLRVRFPTLIPPELVHFDKEIGRFAHHKKSIFKTDDADRRFILNPSCEELVVWALRTFGPLSYRELPKILFDLGQRFRVSEGARGFHRAHEFLLLEAYGFSDSVTSAKSIQQSMIGALARVFACCEIDITSADIAEEGVSKSLNYYMIRREMNGDSKISAFNFTDLQSAADETILVGEKGEVLDTAVRHKEKEGIPIAESDIPRGKETKGFRIAQIADLGQRYAREGLLRYQSSSGKHEFPNCISAGLSINKLLSAIVEAHITSDGMVWPRALAPFDVAIVPLGTVGSDAWQLAESLSAKFSAYSDSVIFDDRDEKASSKLGDHQLIGIPYRVVIGPRALRDGVAQIIRSGSPDALNIPLDEVEAEVLTHLREL